MKKVIRVWSSRLDAQAKEKRWRAQRKAQSNVHSKAQSKPQPKPIDWKKVAREENAYLRSARGLTASPQFVRGGQCSPK